MRLDELWTHAAHTDGPERLFVLCFVLRNRRVRNLQDLRRRTVVRLDAKYLRTGKRLREPKNVLNICGAKRVDGLRIVADDEHVPVDAREPRHDRRLNPIRVLVLVDEDVLELMSERVVGPRLFQDAEEVHEEIVEIHAIRRAFPLIVPRRNCFHLGGDASKPRVTLLEDVVELSLRIPTQADDRLEDARRRESLLGRRNTNVLHAELQKVL